VVRDIHAQFASVELEASPDIEALHLVFIIPHENEWRVAHEFLLVYLDVDVEKRVPRQHGYNRTRKCPPFAPARLLLLLALPNDARVDPQAGIVQENVPINLPYVYLFDMTVDDAFNRALEIHRDAQIFGEVI
jgi:hypothetical protein